MDDKKNPCFRGSDADVSKNIKNVRNIKKIKKAEKAEKLVEGVKTVLVAALFVSLVALASIYFIKTQSTKLNASSGMSFDKIWSQSVGDDTVRTDRFISSQLDPEFVGVRDGGGDPTGISGGSGYIDDIYGSIMPALTSLLGPGSSRSDADASAFDACMDEKDYIYIKYHTALPSSMIYVHCETTADETVNSGASGGEVYILEAFLVPDAAGRLSLVSRDENGAVSVFSSSGEGVSLDSLALDEATGQADMSVFAFARDSYDTDKNTVSSSTALSDTEPRLRKLQFSLPAVGELTSDVLPYEAAEFLRRFNFNADNLSSYTEPSENGVAVSFIETHGTLRVSESGVRYTAVDGGGIDLTDYLSYYRESGRYDLYDSIKAAEAFVATLRASDRRYIGGDAVPCLTALRLDGENIVLEYAYFYGNVRIIFSEDDSPGCAIKLRISGGVLSDFELVPYNVSAKTQSAAVIPRAWLLRLADSLGSGRNYRLALYYFPNDSQTLGAEYMLVSK